jgi:hypothetical protein
VRADREALLRQVLAELGPGFADTLSEEARLSGSIETNSAEQEALLSVIQDDQTRMTDLDSEISGLKVRQGETSHDIGIERLELAQLARNAYLMPDNVFLRLAGARDLGGAALDVADMAGVTTRTDLLSARLSGDQSQLDQVMTQRSSYDEQKISLVNKVVVDMRTLGAVIEAQQSAGSSLRASLAGLQTQLPLVATAEPELASRIAAVLLAEQRQLSAANSQLVWANVALWLVSNPHAALEAGLADQSRRYRFVWPEPTATVSQGFGPSHLSYEPAYNG